MRPAPSAIRIALDRAMGTIPTVVVDGLVYPVQSDELMIPVAPGMHGVAVTETYTTMQGWVSTSVMVAPGETATVYYTAPHMGLGRGRIGSEPQSRPGVGTVIAMWSLIAIPALMLLAIIAIALWIALS